jgi:hypothetical protein
MLVREMRSSPDQLHTVIPTHAVSFVEEIRNLSALHDEGILSDEEFQAVKARLLK